MTKVILYTKDPCPLCDKVKEALSTLHDTYPHTLEEVDITADHDTYTRYRYIIPVVDIGTRTLQAPITLLDLMDALRVAAAN